MDVPWVLDPDELKSKCKNTPFDEARLQGRVVRTIVAGRTVYEYAYDRPARFCFRLSARLDPVRPPADPRPAAPDIRTIGSGNIGATNVLRTGRKGLAAATLLCDMLKGTAAVLLHAPLAGTELRWPPASAHSSAICFRSG